MKSTSSHTISNYLVYPLIYASLVTFATWLVRELPTFLQMEYAIYDPMQRFTTEQEVYLKKPNISLNLENFVGINLDTAFFSLDNERVRRGKLADFLDSLHANTNPRGVFLDFLFASQNSKKPTHKTKEDEQMIQSLKRFDSRIVLPNRNKFKTTDFGETLTSNHLKLGKPLLYENQYSGHLAFRLLVGDDTYRYLPFSMVDNSYYSAVYRLLETTHGKDTPLLILDVPDRIEVNYIVDELEAGKIYDASALLRFDKQRLKEVIEEKIVFIGLFDKYYDKYGVPIDQFKTPLQEETSGIYLTINAYLNVLTGTFFKRAPWVWVFVLNFFIALGGAYYYLENQNITIKRPRQIIAEFIGSSLFFVTLLGWFYVQWSIKFPFVITCLAYVLNQVAFTYFLKFKNKSS